MELGHNTTPSGRPHLLMPSSLITTLRSNLPADIDVAVGLGEGDERDLLHALAAVPDPRARRGVRYGLTSLLAVAVCAVLAGAVTFAAIADWAADLDPAVRLRLGFTRAIPAGSTVWRFLIRLDDQILQAVLTGWLRAAMVHPHRPPRRVGGLSSRWAARWSAVLGCLMGGRCTCCRPMTPPP